MEFCHVSIQGPDIMAIAGADLFPQKEQEAIRRAQEGGENVGMPVYVVRFLVGSSITEGELGYFEFREWHPLETVPFTQEELRARLAFERKRYGR